MRRERRWRGRRKRWRRWIGRGRRRGRRRNQRRRAERRRMCRHCHRTVCEQQAWATHRALAVGAHFDACGRAPLLASRLIVAVMRRRAGQRHGRESEISTVRLGRTTVGPHLRVSCVGLVWWRPCRRRAGAAGRASPAIGAIECDRIDGTLELYHVTTSTSTGR